MKKLFLSIVLLLALFPLAPAYALDCECSSGGGGPGDDCNDCEVLCGGRDQIVAPPDCRAGPSGAAAPAPAPAPAARAPASSPRGPQKGPALIPFCWQKDDCNRNVCAAGSERCKANEADCHCFESHADDRECPAPLWGRCYPPDQPVPLQISIGGVAEVQNLAQYVKIVYRIAVSAATIIATIMLIWGGIQWMIGGAAPEKLSQAKKTIGNAVLGLVLVLASYVILNTINPDLTSFTLPRLQALRPITIGTNWCVDLPKDPATSQYISKVAHAGKLGTYKDINSITSNMYSQDPATTKCDNEYYIQNAGEARCFGQACDPGTGGAPQLCLFQKTDERGNHYTCVDGSMGGNIDYPAGRYVKRIEMIQVCSVRRNELRFGYVTEQNSSDFPDGDDERAGIQTYRRAFDNTFLQLVGNPARLCPDGALKGYLFLVEVHDDDSLVLDQNDWVLVGRAGCSQGKPFASAEIPVDYLRIPRGDAQSLVTGSNVSAAAGGKGEEEKHEKIANLPSSEFFSLSEVQNAARGQGGRGIACNMNTGISIFPTD